MIKSDKIILLFYVVLGISFSIFILNTTSDLDGKTISVLPKKTTDFETSSIIDVDRKTIFNLMTNIEIYPNILPGNISYVNILNQTDNEIIAEEELQEAGIKTKLIVSHTIKPYDEHIIKVNDGDAKGTIITQFFEDYELKTKLTTKVHLNFNGLTSVIYYVPESNLVHALNTVNSNFVEYSKRNVFENKVNSLYFEILNRPADPEGLLRFSSLLESGKISEDELRIELLNSPEKKSMNFKPIDGLTPQTKYVIDDLYEKILLRPADPEGMHYFGNQLENGMSSDDIRNELLSSTEGKATSIFHPLRNKIAPIITTFYERPATDDEINYYHKLIDDGEIELSDVENMLKEIEESPNK